MQIQDVVLNQRTTAVKTQTVCPWMASSLKGGTKGKGKGKSGKGEGYGLNSMDWTILSGDGSWWAAWDGTEIPTLIWESHVPTMSKKTPPRKPKPTKAAKPNDVDMDNFVEAARTVRFTNSRVQQLVTPNHNRFAEFLVRDEDSECVELAEHACNQFGPNFAPQTSCCADVPAGYAAYMKPPEVTSAGTTPTARSSTTTTASSRPKPIPKKKESQSRKQRKE